MSISADYFRYLDHFGPVTTLREMAGDPARENVIALRHDVDHDLDVALEMSYWEHRRGQHATYFVLDTAPYWNTTDFLDKCRQLAEFGHEVGLHLNGLCKWVRGAVNDVQQDLEASLERLRSVGIDIDSISTHGDRLCYERQFINYWCFQDLQPADPAARENGLSAEGIAVSDPRFQIGYPTTHALKREDGAEFPLWSIPMSSVKLRYEAMHISYDRYFTDSGGSWSRTPDPIAHDLTHGRNQILIHPEHWRGLQKLYFFLSTPRSGSKWLSEFLERATPLRGTHEFTLNHRYQDRHLRADKLTREHTNELIANPALVRNLMLESRAWIEESPQDYAEANVYLGHFIGTLDQVFPDATLVHLHRDPKDVIRSLINRDWYDTPEDDRHPSVPVDGWSKMSQFEKACWYVRTVNESLIARCRARLRFETMVTQQERFTRELEALGIPVYPLLAKPLFFARINPSRNYSFPNYADWSERDQASFNRICAAMNRALGYEVDRSESSLGTPDENMGAPVSVGSRDARERPRTLLDFSPTGRRIAILAETARDYLFAAPRALYRAARRTLAPHRGSNHSRSLRFGRAPVWANGCTLKWQKGIPSIYTIPNTNTCVVIGGGTWRRISTDDGWKANIGHWYRGLVELELSGVNFVTFFCLMYGESGDLMEKRQLARVSAMDPVRKFSFKTRALAHRFTLAFYANAQGEGGEVKVRRIVLEERGL